MLLVSNVAPSSPDAAPIGFVGLVVVVTSIRPAG
jgi:hypothetical protein